MTVTDLTYVEVFDLVDAIFGLETDTSIFTVLIRQLANEALTKFGIVPRVWTNEISGGLTLTGAATPIPHDLVLIDSAWWDQGTASEYELEYIDQKDLNSKNPSWKTDSGEPGQYTKDGYNIILDTIPSDAVGKLAIRGMGIVGEFSDEEAAVDPLASMVRRVQMTAAYYVLAELPCQPDNPLSTYRKQEYKLKWEVEYRSALDEIRRLKYEPYRGN
jgi:hypothetical protein